MDILALGAAATILVAIVAFVLGLSVVPAHVQARTRLEMVLSGATSAIEAAGVDPLRARKRLGIFQAIVSGDWLERMNKDLRLADSRMQPVDLLALRVGTAGIGVAVPIILPGGVIGVLVAVATGFVGFQLPQMWINRRIQGRANKLEEQLPDALTMIANSLKAGFGLMQALNMASEQLENPVAAELALTVHETNVGSSMEEAFQALSDRNGSYDLDIVVTAILVQRTAGGNLAEILENVTHTMRERVRIRGEINTLTAQQKLTGIVIALLPVGVAGMFLLISPEYISVLFTTTLGRVMLGAGGLLEFVGVMIIKRILAIEV
jgi:tight adherence protein B